MKTGFCEFCPVTPDACVVCESMVWEDDGGRVIDHDADTTPADTVPEVAALTRAGLDALEVEPVGWRLYAVVFAGATLWVGAAVFAVGRHARWW